MKPTDSSISPNVTLIPPTQAVGCRGSMPPGFYQVLDAPAPLAGCAFPFGYDGWGILHDLGFRHVVCLSSETPSYSCEPLQLSVACELDDLSVIQKPASPERERRSIGRIGRQVVDWLHAGEGVLVHCAAGRGRTGTVVGATLRYLGVPADEIVSYLDDLHWIRSGKEWPEAKWQADILTSFYREVHKICGL